MILDRDDCIRKPSDNFLTLIITYRLLTAPTPSTSLIILTISYKSCLKAQLLQINSLIIDSAKW